MLILARIRWAAFAVACFGAWTLTAADAAATPLSGRGKQTDASQTRRAARDLDRLFADEMKTAIARLHWHGEKLTEDTLYAAVVTGDSWEGCWGKEPMFSLAWGDSRKLHALKKQGFRDRQGEIDNVRSLYMARDYRRAIDTATAAFSLDEIGCNASLKEYVGGSLMALGQPEQAFPVYCEPFEPAPAEARASANNRRFRQAALDAAMRAGLKKEAVAFSLSLLLEPDQLTKPDDQQLAYLESQGVDIDRVVLGILQAPEHLRGLPAYYYPAADLMAYRASPRLLPVMLQLADSGDVYLRSRAVLGLGMVAFQSRSSDPTGWAQGIVYASPREYGISTTERRLIDRHIRDNAGSDRYRVRAAAALAMGLIGDQDFTAELQRMSKDRAYILLEENTGQSKARTIYHPVRMAVSAALDRFGISVEPQSGATLSGRDLDRAKRGGSDETGDHHGLRNDVPGTLLISPIDVTMNLREEK